MSSAIPSDQVMAIMRLKQWAFDRTQLRHGRTARNEFSGWRERRQREADSRNVRVVDFERALSQLDPMHQQILLLTYRDAILVHRPLSQGHHHQSERSQKEVTTPPVLLRSPPNRRQVRARVQRRQVPGPLVRQPAPAARLAAILHNAAVDLWDVPTKQDAAQMWEKPAPSPAAFLAACPSS